MSNSLTVRLVGDSSSLNEALNDARQAIGNLQHDASKLDIIQSKFESIVKSTAPIKKKLRDIQQLMAQMNLDGLTNTDVFAQLAEQAGTYADALGDARTAVNAFANDNMNLQATAEGFQLITGSAAVLTGTLGMLGVENDKVEQAMLKVQSAIALVNGVTSIANILNKDSALMLKLKSLRLAANTAVKKANTAAEQQNSAATIANTASTATNATVTATASTATAANTIASVANTVATTANNAARRIWNMTVAISKALMGDFTGLVILGAAALTTYALCTDDSTESTEKNNNAVKYSKKVIKEYSDELASVMKRNVERVRELQNQFNSLQTEGAKTEWIKHNQSELENLGVTINDLINLDKQFENENSSVIAAMENRAKTVNNLNQAHNKYLENTATKSGELVGKFMTLKREWDNLKSTAEKTDWLNENKSAFDNLGLSVNDLTTAERIFVNDTANVVKALEARAKAIASQNALVDAYSDYYKQKYDNATTVEGGGKYVKASAGQTLSKEQSAQVLKEIGSYTRGGEHLYNDGYFVKEKGKLKLTEKGADALNEKRQQEARQRRANADSRAEEELTKKTTFYTKEIEKNTQSIKSLGLDDVVSSTKKGNTASSSKTVGSSKSVGSKSAKSEKIDYLVSVDDNTLETAEKKLQAWQNKKKTVKIDDVEGLKECDDAIKKWQNEVTKRKLIVEFGEDVFDNLNSLQSQLEELERQKLEIEGAVNISTEDAQKKIDDIDERLGNLKGKQIELTSKADDLNAIRDQINALESKRIEISAHCSPEELNALESQINALESKRIEIVASCSSEELNALESQINALKSKEIELTVNGSSDDINAVRNEINALKSKEIEVVTNVSDEELNAVRNEINSLTRQRNLILLSVSGSTDDIDAIEERLNALQSKEIELTVNGSFEELNAVRNEINALTKQKNLIQLSVETTQTSNSVERINSEINDLENDKKQIQISVDGDYSELANIDRQIQSLNDRLVKINVDADNSEIETVNQQIQSLSDKNVNINIDADVDNTEIENINKQLQSLNDRNVNINVDADNSEIDNVNQQIQNLSDKNVNINVDADNSEIEIDNINQQIQSLNDRKVDISFNIASKQQEIEDIQSRIDMLDSKRIDITVGTDTDDLSNLNKEIERLRGQILVESIKIGFKPEIEKGSKIDLENEIKKLEDTRKILFQTNADPSTIKFVDDEIKNLKKNLESEEIRLGIKPNIEVGSLNEIKKRIKEKEEEINLALNTNINPDSMKKLQSELDNLRKVEESKEIELGIKVNTPTVHKDETKFERGSVEDKRQSMDNARSMTEEIKQNYRLGLIGKDEVESQLNQINSQLQELGLKPIELHINNDGTLTDAVEDLEKLKSQMDDTSSIVGSLGNVFGSLGSAIGDTTGEWMNFAGKSLSAISQIIPQIVTLITAKQAEALAGGTASAAAMPFPANLAAIASIIATITSIFASLPKFENGGIVGGTSYTGDKLLARVNSGEMILNKAQQRNLYNSMNDAGIGTPQSNTLRGDVEFKISGSSLKGCLRNYDSKMSKIR